ncbi:MAG: hypothetical protein DMF53_17425 [Acidobacteria bacterium]|nr:MAG: hypothetical protein DMF53_17425 [Acidobacteriota bacterium]
MSGSISTTSWRRWSRSKDFLTAFNFCERYREIPWKGIVAFRNIAVHAYFAIEWPIVWVAATEEAPLLRNQVAEILARDFPDETP